VPTKTSARPLAVVILAAGKGKRLRSKLPKVLHPVCGRPALWHVLRAATASRPDRVVIVVHHGRERVEEAVRSWAPKPEPIFVDQGEPLGTGHAVKVAKKAIGGVTDVLVLAGDDPLIEGTHLRRLMSAHRRTTAAATILTSEVDDPSGYGRVIREGAELVEIVEESEASPSIRRLREISTLFYAFRREHLFRVLPKVGRENRLREYYLPDVLPILMDTGERVRVVRDDTYMHVGLNSRNSLAQVNALMRRRINRAHMDRGVSLVDPSQTYIDVDVRIGADSTIYPMTFLRGSTRIGSECEIGPSVQVRDTKVGDGSVVLFAVVEDSALGARVTVGPFARLRPGTVIEDGAYVGSYVEIKGSRIGPGSKVPHLSYVGDAQVGKDVNIGAATVTVNWDGYDKFPTVVEDGARIGSDTMLVAPVRVGKGAATGAGSVITKDVPAGALAVERSEQRTVKGYRKRKDAEHSGAASKKASGTKGRGKKRSPKRT
jgi:bifunctional UDP-N-acetylglucosamine pyrophosphorylase / glucosamine-1-phosphate N-acetyltransferase